MGFVNIYKLIKKIIQFIEQISKKLQFKQFNQSIVVIKLLI